MAQRDQDWEGLAAFLPATFVCENRRMTGFGTLHGPDAFIDSQRAMFELAPDARSRLDHARLSDFGVLYDAVWVGTRDGGAFESQSLVVLEFDADGTPVPVEPNRAEIVSTKDARVTIIRIDLTRDELVRAQLSQLQSRAKPENREPATRDVGAPLAQ